MDEANWGEQPANSCSWTVASKKGCLGIIIQCIMIVFMEACAWQMKLHKRY